MKKKVDKFAKIATLQKAYGLQAIQDVDFYF